MTNQIQGRVALSVASAGVVAICMLASTRAVVAQNASKPAPSPEVGQVAPDLVLKTAGGKPAKLKELAKGKVLLVQFMFLDSGFCRTEFPYLQKSHDQYRADGLQVVSVDIGQAGDAQAAARYWQANSLTFPVLMNGTNENDARKTYGVAVCPGTFLVDREGKITAKWFGFSPTTGPDRLKAELAKVGFK
jgi:peroxiredoxin